MESRGNNTELADEEQEKIYDAAADRDKLPTNVGHQFAGHPTLPATYLV